MRGSPQPIEADYLVVGAGAMGMAFTDTLITDIRGTRGHRRPRPSTGWTLDHRVPIRAAAPAVGVLRRQFKGIGQQHH